MRRFILWLLAELRRRRRVEKGALFREAFQDYWGVYEIQMGEALRRLAALEARTSELERRQ